VVYIANDTNIDVFFNMYIHYFASICTNINDITYGYFQYYYTIELGKYENNSISLKQ